MITAILSGGGVTAVGRTRPFDQAIFLFVFYIMASYKYVNSDVNLLMSWGSYTLLCKPIIWDNMIVWSLVYCEKCVHVKIWQGGCENRGMWMGKCFVFNVRSCERGQKKQLYLTIYCWSWRITSCGSHYLSQESFGDIWKVCLENGVYTCALEKPSPVI